VTVSQPQTWQGSVVVVVVDVVVVVVVGHTSVTMPPPSVVTAGCTHVSSTAACGEPPSGQVPALNTAVENFAVAFERHVVSTARPLAAALE
jgi:hypothetical protein